MSSLRPLLAAGLTLLLPALSPWQSRGQAPAAKTSELVLFPFDDHAIPFSKGLILTLLPGRKSATNPQLGLDKDHPGKPVLAKGKAGDPDEKRVYFFGTVLKVGEEFRMWYSAHDGHRRQVCHAVSKDGLSWTKPKLGLVDYQGNRDNNLVSVGGDQVMQGMSALVIHDEADSNPARRFKMIREINPADIRAAVSPDGIRWTDVAGGKDVIKGSSFEPSGFIRRNGVYILSGHGGPVPHPVASQSYMRPQKRMMVNLVSYDFENWIDAGHVSFRRDNVPPRPVLDWEFHRGEQVHLGASLWDRGNVVLGFYGQYHNETNDRRTSHCDIGLIVSQDGIHFREPLPDFKLVPSFEENDRAEPRLTQGQAFANIGNRTIHYYGIWTEVDRNGPTGVRIATWPRDRLGYFAPSQTAENAHCVSAPFALPRSDARLAINATGLGDQGNGLSVELLDEQFRSIPGFTAADFVSFETPSGLRLPVRWKEKQTLAGVQGPIRVRVNWREETREVAKLFAIYLE